MAYLQALRQHTDNSDSAVTAAALGTLSRVASACARLHMRGEVLATPDVVLSILLFEESMEHQVTTISVHTSNLHCHLFTAAVDKLRSSQKVSILATTCDV